jgi:hypothetical protein
MVFYAVELHIRQTGTGSRPGRLVVMVREDEILTPFL